MNTNWHGVPREWDVLWGDVFEASEEGSRLAAPCPVCGSPALRRWFDLHDPTPRLYAGIRWAGRGSQWQWCADCRSYLHTSGVVPMWWHTDLVVDPKTLMHDPGPIQAVMDTSEPGGTSS
ncbi:hypothetical protein [Catellatospora vulcania]|uniref:hypothetical protein n=1 Tax=Catellatospora vulcania TaxID=1460450 RepID=UPI0018AFC66A|nr:hypothetical protein [Catellatospora vulcania]